jgi:hypothetical protein
VKHVLSSLCLAAAVSADAQEPYPNRAVKVIVRTLQGDAVTEICNIVGETGRKSH